MGRGNFEGVGASLDPAVICPKTAEPIEMPFESWASMGPRNHVLDGSPDLHISVGNFWGKGHSAVSCAEPIEMPFGMLSQVERRNHKLDRGTDPHGKGQF